MNIRDKTNDEMIFPRKGQSKFIKIVDPQIW